MPQWNFCIDGIARSPAPASMAKVAFPGDRRQCVHMIVITCIATDAIDIREEQNR